MPDNNKKDVLLYADSCFDENKNKFILEETIAFIKYAWWSAGPLPE